MEKEATINSLFGETIYYTHIENNNEKIIVMRSYSKDKDDISGGGAIAIPKGWVTKIEYLEVSYGERSNNK